MSEVEEAMKEYGGPDILAAFSESEKHLKVGDVDAALEKAQEAFAAKPDNKHYSDHLAAVIKARGEKPEGKEPAEKPEGPTTMQDLVDEAWKKPPKKDGK